MPARLVQVTLINNSSFPIRWVDDHRPHGFWQEPWYPSNFTDLRPGQIAQWRLESGGVMTGVEGSAKFKVDVPLLRDGTDESELLTFWWERPYIGSFAKNFTHEVPLRNSRHDYLPHVRVIDHEFRGWGGSSFGDVLAHVFLPFPLSPVVTMANEASGTHISWTVEVVDQEGRQSLPLQIAPSVLYGIQDDWDLLWYRREGRDGSFTWADHSGTKVGNGWDFSHVFSGGEGVVYGVEKTTLDPRTGRRGGGNLMWYRHDGWQNGGPEWAGPHKVGTGWGDFKQVFHAGEGVIYAIRDNGDLLWYKHDGRANGAFKWAQGSGKKVGAGWDFKHVFSGGGGIIYAIQDRRLDARTGQRVGGNLLWYRHDGWQDGGAGWTGPTTAGTRWDGFRQALHCSDGIIYATQETSLDPATGRRMGGHLLWYRHQGRDDGAQNWAEGSGKIVGIGWNFAAIFAA